MATSFSSAGTLLASEAITSFDGAHDTDSASDDTSLDDHDDKEAKKYLQSLLSPNSLPKSCTPDHRDHHPAKLNTSKAIATPKVKKLATFHPPPTPETTPSKPASLRLYGGELASSITSAKDPSTPESTLKEILFGRLRPTPLDEIDNEDDIITTPTKRHKPTLPVSPSPSTPPSTQRRTLFHKSSAPRFSIAHRNSSSSATPSRAQRQIKKVKEVRLGAIEMERVSESVLRQVDWNRVSEDVAANRSGRLYKRYVRRLLKGHVEGED